MLYKGYSLPSCEREGVADVVKEKWVEDDVFHHHQKKTWLA